MTLASFSCLLKKKKKRKKVWLRPCLWCNGLSKSHHKLSSLSENLSNSYKIQSGTCESLISGGLLTLYAMHTDNVGRVQVSPGLLAFVEGPNL